jgi:hypothetical protein
MTGTVVGADHDGIDVAREHLGRVGDRLAAPDLHVRVVERQRLAAELAHGHVEGDAGAGGGLLEDEHQDGVGDAGGPQLVRHALARPLHGVAHVDDAAQGTPVDMIEIQKMPGRPG